MRPFQVANRATILAFVDHIEKEEREELETKSRAYNFNFAGFRPMAGSDGSCAVPASREPAQSHPVAKSGAPASKVAHQRFVWTALFSAAKRPLLPLPGPEVPLRRPATSDATADSPISDQGENLSAASGDLAAPEDSAGLEERLGGERLVVKEKRHSHSADWTKERADCKRHKYD